MRNVRIFVSSPGDALDERRRVSRIVERLNRAFRDSVHLDAVRWEERFYSAHDGFQPQIPRSGDCDLVLAILRGRLGSPLSPAFHDGLPPDERLPDGKVYPSGTAYEILSAIRRRQRGSPLPDIYVFRWPEPPQVSLDAPDRAEVEAQWNALKRFAEDVFFTAEGHFKGAYQTYASLDDFEAQVEALLRGWLKAHVLGERAILWPAERGSPFRGLEPFGMRHSEVFFGRTRDLARSVAKFRVAATDGLPIQLIVGPSGSGKSSFVRAGLMPMLVAPGNVEGVGVWRVALMRPGENSDGPAAALAQRLFEASDDIEGAEFGRPEALPNLRHGAFPTPEALLQLFAHGDAACAAPVVAALAQIAEAERLRWGAEHALPARLLLIVDQLDEIFTSKISDEQRADFARILDSFVRSGAVWIVATLRADVFDIFLKSPLAALIGDDRTITLKPPGLAELAEIVREPARAADLEWEIDPDSGERLDERLLADIDRPDLLPLLQFVLNRLYEKREGGGEQSQRLTFAAYRALGTLDGALDAAARQALAPLGTAEQAHLPRLLRALVVAAPVSAVAGSKSSLTLQSIPLSQAAPDETGLRLANALVEARILVTSSGERGEPLISLAHQRVIEAWQQARTIFASSGDFYRVRADVAAQRSRWTEAGKRAELLIPRGLPLAEAEQLVSRFADELPRADMDFIRASRTRANRATTLFASLALVLGLAATLAAAAGWFAKQQKGVADQEKAKAESAAALAAQQRDKAVTNRSFLLADLGRQRNASGDFGTAIGLAAAALVDPYDNHIVTAPEAQRVLRQGLWNLRELATIRLPDGVIAQVSMFSPDGSRLLAGSTDGVLRMWDVKSGSLLKTMIGHASAITAAAFSSDGALIVTGDLKGELRLWHGENGDMIRRLSPHEQRVTWTEFSPDSQKVISAGWDNVVHIHDVTASTHDATLYGHKNHIWSARLSPDQKTILTAAEDGVRVYSATTHQPIKQFDGMFGAMGAAYSPDGVSFLTVHRDGQLYLWDATSLTIRGHIQDIDVACTDCAAFSPDGKRLAVGSKGGVTIADATSGAVIAKTQAPNSSPSNHVRITADGKFILSDSGTGLATLSKMTDGGTYQSFGGHSDFIASVAASPDASRFATTARDGTVRLWSQKPFAGSSYIPATLPTWGLYSPDGHTVAINEQSDSNAPIHTAGQLAIFDNRTGSYTRLSPYHHDNIDVGAYSPTGDFLITVSQGLGVFFRDGRRSFEKPMVGLWNVRDGSRVAALEGHDDRINSVAFSHAGSLAITASNDGTARMWDIPTGNFIRSLAKHSGNVLKAVFSPSDDRIVSISQDHTVGLWNGDGEILKRLEGHSETVRFVSFSPDGQMFATGGDDRSIQVWSTENGDRIATLNGHEAAITDVAMVSQNRVLSTSKDGTARLWDIGTGTVVVQSPQRSYNGGAASHSEDGRFVSMSWGNSEVRIFKTDTGQEVAQLKTLPMEQHQIFLPKSHILLVDSNYGFELWDVPTALKVGEMELPFDFGQTMIVSPAGNDIVVKDSVNYRNMHTWRNVHDLLSQTESFPAFVVKKRPEFAKLFE